MTAKMATFIASFIKALYTLIGNFLELPAYDEEEVNDFLNNFVKETEA